MKRGFVILIIGSVLVLFGFSFLILHDEGFGKMDTTIMQPIEGFDYAVFVIGRFGFIIGIVGVIIQVVGGVILFLDRRIGSTT
ncbi:MAG: hypothetical protein HZA84_08780 [Thaumarchaeota archaeon]|nr:hypothetical protein [Nitrososphaerota archaeon]